MKRKNIIFCILLGLSAFMASCREPIIDPNLPVIDENFEVGQPITIQGSFTYPGMTKNKGKEITRSVEEGRVESLTIMVFNRDSIFVEISTATLDAQTGDVWTYRSIITSTEQERIFQFVVNYNFMDHPELSTSFFRGMSMSQAMGYIVDETNYNDGQDHAIMMWGRVLLPEVLPDTEIPTVHVYRDVAKITLSASTEVYSNYLDVNTVYLFNSMRTGQVAPETLDTISRWHRATEPKEKFLDTLTVSLGETGLSQATSWYMFERRVQSLDVSLDSACFLVFKGRYIDDEVDTYYKIMLADLDTLNDNYRFNPCEIYRNTHYQVLLKWVASSGYPTIEEALVRPPSNNIVIETISSSEAVQDEVTNGQYKLGITYSQVTLYNVPIGITDSLITPVFVNRVEGITDSISGGINPNIEDAYAIVIAHSNQLLLKPNGQPYVVGDTMPITNHCVDKISGELRAKYNLFTSGVIRTATIRVKVGNLSRDINIYQGELRQFVGLPDVLYVGWQPGLAVDLFVEAEGSETYPLTITCSFVMDSGDNAGFLNFESGEDVKDVTIENQSTTFTMTTTSGYYGEAGSAIYRTQQVIVSANGFLTDTVLIKQSKYLDGLAGQGAIGIYRGNDDTAIYEMVFDDTEEPWYVKVEQGSDWLKIGKDIYSSVNTDSISGQRVVSFAYRMETNNTGANRYGKLVLYYGASLAQHTIYVCQGYYDVSLGGYTWAARNVDAPGAFSPSPDDPGSLYKRDQLIPYDACVPSFHIPYSEGHPDLPEDYYETSGVGVYSSSNAWSTNNSDGLCPSGYRLPEEYHYQAIVKEVTTSNIGRPVISGINGANLMYYGFVNHSSDRSTAGILFVNETAAGVLNNMLFLPCPGVRHSVLGYLDSTHSLRALAFGNEPDYTNPYLYQSGCYFGANVACLDIYHDVMDNIGLYPGTTFASGWISGTVNGGTQVLTNDSADDNYHGHLAAPVRCIKQ